MGTHMHLVGIQRLACSLPTASRLYSLTSRYLTARPSQLCPRLGLHMSLTPLTRLSSYGPASLDSAPNLEHVQTCEGKTMGQRLEVRGYGKTISPPRLSHFLNQHVERTPRSNPRGWPKDSILRMSACVWGFRQVGVGVDRARLGVGAGGEV